VETDELLLRRVREGDMGAFDRLYERHEVALFGYLRILCGNRHDAEEIFHDAFLAALKSAGTNVEEGAFRAWLYRIARNLASNRRRAEGRHDKHVREAGVAMRADQGDREATDAARALEERELDAALEDAVRRLPPALGELYHLRVNGLSYEQIARVVEAPLGTVKSRMHQMVNLLREELEPWIAQK
jgi:RNA polymerase sigma-70 factor, ECF subfamily